jgi:flagellar biosynthetic protein FliR
MLELFSLYNNLDIFIIIAMRISGYVLVSPIFGRREVSNFLKISLILYLTYIIIFSESFSMEYIPETNLQFITLAIVELLKGFLTGFMTSLFFSAFLTAGQFIDIRIGFRMGGILDPQYGIKTPLSSNVLNIIAMAVFLILDGHLQLINIVSHTYQASPVGNLEFLKNIYLVFTGAFSFAFLSAFKIALPIILMIFLADVVLLVLIKFMPQMNIFVIGIPMKILVGIFSLFYIIEPFTDFLEPYFNTMYDSIWQIFM